MRITDAKYYERRAEEEREKARVAPDPAVARTHTIMAEEYERRVRESQPFQSGISESATSVT